MATQYLTLVQGDMVSFVAFDLVLRIIYGGVMDVSFVVDVPGMYSNDSTGYPTGFRVPAYVIADFEALSHDAASRSVMRAYTRN
jgi:hypothetical protein